MTKAIVGVIGGSGVYHLPGLKDLREENGDDALGRTVRRAALRPYREHGRRLPRAPRPRPPVLAFDDQLPRQHRRAEASRRHRHHRAFRMRIVPPGALSGRVRDDRSVRRSHLSASVELLRHRLRGACLDGPPGRSAPAPSPARRGRGRGHSMQGRRHYVCMEGPQFSSFAESIGYQGGGADVIGMTGATEAKLAREAEISYATVAMVTDYDCWHEEHDAVDVAAVVKVMTDNADKAGALVARALRGFSRRARALPDRVRPRARIRDHHTCGRARSGTRDEARHGRRARAAARLSLIVVWPRVLVGKSRLAREDAGDGLRRTILWSGVDGRMALIWRNWARLEADLDKGRLVMSTETAKPVQCSAGQRAAELSPARQAERIDLQHRLRLLLLPVEGSALSQRQAPHVGGDARKLHPPAPRIPPHARGDGRLAGGRADPDEARILRARGRTGAKNIAGPARQFSRPFRPTACCSTTPGAPSSRNTTFSSASASTDRASCMTPTGVTERARARSIS